MHDPDTPRRESPPAGVNRTTGQSESARNCGPVHPELQATPAQFIAAALAYRKRGWWPIPVRGKRPMGGKGWPDWRLTDDAIRATWGGGRPPNIGILTGEPSRQVVLDIDASAVYRPWAALHPDAAKTLRVTRSNAEPGRCHLYFTLAPGQPAPANCSGEGWDLLSTGRQVVAPPSLHASGARYAFTSGPEPLPWRDEYTPPTPAKTARVYAPSPAAAVPPTPANLSGVQAVRAVARQGAESVRQAPVGKRNRTLRNATLRTASAAKWLGVDPEIGAPILQAAGVAARLPARDCRATIRGAIAYARPRPLRRRTLQLPPALWGYPSLKPSARLLVAFMATHARAGVLEKWSLPDMGTALSISWRTVLRDVADFEARRWLKIVSGYTGVTTRYILRFPPELTEIDPNSDPTPENDPAGQPAGPPAPPASPAETRRGPDHD